jgi:hypothetical protein
MPTLNAPTANITVLLRQIRKLRWHFRSFPITMALNPDWNEFVELLLANEVEFLVVGAIAAAYHGVPRNTGDIDFYIGNSRVNAERVLRVVQEFGFTSGLTVEDFMADDQVVQLGYPPRRIDLLTKIEAVPFTEAWMRRVPGRLDDHSVFFLCRDDFIANKRALGRPKDLMDIAAVESISE